MLNLPIPLEIQNTIDWLIKIEAFNLAQQLAMKACSYAPPDAIEALDYLAMVHFKTKNFKEAIRYAKKTVELLPQNLEAHLNLAKCYHCGGEPSLAVLHINEVLKFKHDWTDALIEKSVYLHASGNWQESESILLNIEKKVNLTKHQASVIKFNLAWHQIANGQFKKGIEGLTVGRSLGIWGRGHSNLSAPLLQQGDRLQNKTILVLGEGGAGDEIISLRFAQTIAKRGGKTIFVTGHNLQEVFKSNEFVSRVIIPNELSNVQYDFYAPAMDLPYLLGLDLNEIPAKKYLSPSKDFLKKWQKYFSEEKKLKVGIRWQGNQLYEHDLYRSVPFRDFHPFFENKNIQFYSLQRDSGLEEFDPSTGVLDLSSKLETWEDTAAVIANLDLVITSCTSIAHLAGALGVKTWVFCPVNSYYIWATPQDQSPWYPDLKLYRQKVFRNWAEPCKDMQQDMIRLAQEISF